MTEPDKAELQRLAQLVEANRERLQSLEQQIRSLEGIKLEQEHAMEALGAISEDGEKGAMIPLGAGVQVVADIQPDAGAVVDIGSRIQAEKTREEAIQILSKRNEDLLGILQSINQEYRDLENHVVELANTFNETVDGMQIKEPKQNQPDQAETPVPRRRSRRKRGTELTLDD